MSDDFETQRVAELHAWEAQQRANAERDNAQREAAREADRAEATRSRIQREYNDDERKACIERERDERDNGQFGGSTSGATTGTGRGSQGITRKPLSRFSLAVWAATIGIVFSMVWYEQRFMGGVDVSKPVLLVAAAALITSRTVRRLVLGCVVLIVLLKGLIFASVRYGGIKVYNRMPIPNTPSARFLEWVAPDFLVVHDSPVRKEKSSQAKSNSGHPKSFHPSMGR